MFDPSTWSRENLERHSVDMRQFIDFRQSTLPNGMRIIQAYNSSGLTFTILPDRGLDIWTAHYNGIPLTWISQGSPFPPDFGQNWLQQFNGGLLTTCGLTHVGPLEVDDITGEVRGIHGKYSQLRAYNVGVTDRGWNDFYSVQLKGTASEASLFGTQLQLNRTYKISLGLPAVEIEDTVTNLGDEPAPFMLLYHFNFGYPLVAEGTKLYVNSIVYPRDAAAQAGYVTWSEYEQAIAGYPEQVFFHHVRSNDTLARAGLFRDELGVVLTWDHRTLPYLGQWKNTRAGIYVNGVEPANCLPEGQNAARRSGRLMMLKPGEVYSTSCTLSVQSGEQQIERWQRALIDEKGTPIENCYLDDYAHLIP
jgi:galactose mutarotase-like enzyme